MLNQCTIIGRVVEVLEDKDARVVILRTGGGVSRNGKEWEEHVACRFWGDSKKWTEKVGDGVLLKVDGQAKSRKSDKGNWFTSIDGRYAQVVGGTARAPSGSGSGSSSQRANDPPPVDDSDIPF